MRFKLRKSGAVMFPPSLVDLVMALILVLIPMFGTAQSSSLTDLTLEQLADLKVTSVSKKLENLFQAPAAITVITGEDMRRGGFTTLPDALRMVPGLYVVQISPHQWEVSARGFGNLQNNKMLVLVDGRTVYTPEYGGVDWDVLDLPLEDVDRIEVIRGPGGTLWGANAMNGVINILMKPSPQTPGMEISTSADLDQGYTALVQYGGKIGEPLTYHLSAKLLTGSHTTPRASSFPTISISPGPACGRTGTPHSTTISAWKVKPTKEVSATSNFFRPFRRPPC